MKSSITDEITKDPKPPSRWIELFRVVGILMFSLAILIGVGSYQYLKPKYDLAQTIDLKALHHINSLSSTSDRDGEKKGRTSDENHRYISIDEVSNDLINAIIAVEDSQFHNHSGYDVKLISSSFYNSLTRRKKIQGTSTITEQLLRATYNGHSSSSHPVNRKVVRLFLAARVEREFDKPEILGMYLNRVYFGGGYYGVLDASEGFFGKTPKALTLAESATLAGALRQPSYCDPRRNPKASEANRDRVLQAMYCEGYIERTDLTKALNENIEVVYKSPKRSSEG